VNWRRFEVTNMATAAGSILSPKASGASGSPMFPELLNIMGGTKVRGLTRSRRATGQASRPEASTTTRLPRMSAWFSRSEKSLRDREERMSAGTKTSMFIRLTQEISGRTTRP
jgi:hypothetical protein